MKQEKTKQQPDQENHTATTDQHTQRGPQDTQQENTTPKPSREEELLNDLKRVQADYENYRKRVERDREEHIKFASKNIVVNLLDIVDNLNFALANKDKHEEFVKGIEMIYAQLLSKLEDEGLEIMKINTDTDQKVNPYEHEALMTEPSDKPKNTILRIIQNGYTLHGQVIRHAKVIVSKGSKEETTQQST